MSFGEILVVILISCLVVKPEDIPAIVKKIREIKSYFTNFKNHTLSYFTSDLVLKEDIKTINFYLEKIILLEGQYTGEYSLEKVKERYYEVIKNSIKKDELL